MVAMLIIAMLSITSVKFKMDADGFHFELKKAEQKLAEAQAGQFFLAGDCLAESPKEKI